MLKQRNAGTLSSVDIPGRNRGLQLVMYPPAYLVRYRTTAIIVTALMLLNATYVSAQGSADVLREQFDSYRKSNLQEKIYVHTDKNNYVPGEICWFKIYNVDACFHRPIDLGKCAYVEVLDRNNRAVLQAKIALEKGTGEGSLFLPATLVSGTYRLRAYTNWMKNYGADYFFEKKLNILNAQKSRAEYAVAQKPAYDIAFFPEGGNLVNGIRSRIGFRVVNHYGKGVSCNGSIINEKKETVTTFRSLKFGIGSFDLTPVAGAKYTAIIKLPGNEKQIKELPAAFNSGYVMRLDDNHNGEIKVTVQISVQNSPSPNPLFLFVHTRNVVEAVMSNTPKNGKVEFLLHDTTTGEGISHFTVFNDYRQPVCERLYFKKPARILQITATPDQAVYETRKKISIGISSATETGKNIAANMSMAIYRVDSLMPDDGLDITNYLLLSADLPGTVESPEYYFRDDDTAKAALDNLMLTQGWRRFKWDDILANRKPAFQFVPEINGHIVYGKLTALHAGLPLKGIWAYLSVPGIRTQFQTAAADSDGNIKFEMKDFYSDGDIIVQTNNEKDSGYRIDIMQPFFTGYSGKIPAPLDFTVPNAPLLKMYIGSQVQNAFFYEKLNKSIMPRLDTAAFYVKPDKVYLLDNYVRFTTLEEVLREYVLEVMVRQPGGKFHLPVYDEITRTIFSDPPLALIDGVPIFNFNKLMSYDPLKIRKLEVVGRRYFRQGNSFDGIINFTTYKGDIPGLEIDPRATVVDYEGLQLQREFYSPVYETRAQYLSRLPDFRSLLYWSPHVITGKDGKQEAAFYAGDIPGRYAIVIEGVSEDGRMGSKVAWFDVRTGGNADGKVD